MENRIFNFDNDSKILTPFAWIWHSASNAAKLMDIMQTHECTVPYYKSVIAAGRPLNSVDLDYIKMKSKHCKNR